MLKHKLLFTVVMAQTASFSHIFTTQSTPPAPSPLPLPIHISAPQGLRCCGRMGEGPGETGRSGELPEPCALTAGGMGALADPMGLAARCRSCGRPMMRARRPLGTTRETPDSAARDQTLDVKLVRPSGASSSFAANMAWVSGMSSWAWPAAWPQCCVSSDCGGLENGCCQSTWLLPGMWMRQVRVQCFTTTCLHAVCVDATQCCHQAKWKRAQWRFYKHTRQLQAQAWAPSSHSLKFAPPNMCWPRMNLEVVGVAPPAIKVREDGE